MAAGKPGSMGDGTHPGSVLNHAAVELAFQSMEL